MITRDEWLNAMATLEPANDPSAFGLSELARLLGIPRSTLRERLPRLVESGRVIKTQKYVRGQLIVAYRLPQTE